MRKLVNKYKGLEKKKISLERVPSELYYRYLFNFTRSLALVNLQSDSSDVYAGNFACHHVGKFIDSNDLHLSSTYIFSLVDLECLLIKYSNKKKAIFLILNL